MTPPALRAALLCDLVDWLRSEPEQGSLISTSLADYLLARGWTHAPGAAGPQPEEVMPSVQRESDVHLREVEPAVPGTRATVVPAPVAGVPQYDKAYNDAMLELAAARDDADRLAEALRKCADHIQIYPMIHDTEPGEADSQKAALSAAHAALAAHAASRAEPKA